MRLFSQILEEKLKKQDLLREEKCVEEAFPSANTEVYNGLGIDLLRWLNSSPLAQKNYYKVEESSYSTYKKDPREIEKLKIQREKEALESFLTRIPSEKEKESVLFFYTHGARSFMSFRGGDLKKDFKKLALKLHPDRHFNVSPSEQQRFHEDFRVLSESYETLKMLFSRAK